MAWPASGAGGAVILQRRGSGHHIHQQQQSVGLLTALALSTGFLLFSNLLTTTFRNLKRARRRSRSSHAPPPATSHVAHDASDNRSARNRADTCKSENPIVCDTSTCFASTHKEMKAILRPADERQQYSSTTRSQSEQKLAGVNVVDEEALAIARRSKRDAVAARYKHDSSQPCSLAKKYLSKAQSVNHVDRPGGAALHQQAAKTYEGRYNINVSSRRTSNMDLPHYMKQNSSPEQRSSPNLHRLYDIQVATNSASSSLHLHADEIKVIRTTKKVRFSCSDIHHPDLLQEYVGIAGASASKDAHTKISSFSSRRAGRRYRCGGHTHVNTISSTQVPTEKITQANTSCPSSITNNNNTPPPSTTLNSSATLSPTSYASKCYTATKRPYAPEPLKPSWQKI